MNRWSFGLAVAGAVLLGPLVFGCEPSNKVPGGAPVVLSFDPVDATGSVVSLTGEAAVASVPPLAHFVATFDRLIDPSTLEDPGPDGGPKAGVASVTYAGGPVPATTNYVPNGDSKLFLAFPPGPSLTVTPAMGLPSGSQVTVALDAQKLRSHDQRTLAVPAAGVQTTLTFATDPLAVSSDAPAAMTDDAGGAATPGTGAPDLVVTVSFNDATPPDDVSHIKVSGTMAGVPIVGLGGTVAANDMDPTQWKVSPPDPGGWPVGALVTVTVDAGATDAFGIKLGTDATFSFMVVAP